MKQPTLEPGLHFGFEVSLFDGEHWHDLYGMPGRYLKTFKEARQEVRYALNWSLRKDEWKGWTIERIVIDGDGFCKHHHPMNVTLVQSQKGFEV